MSRWQWLWQRGTQRMTYAALTAAFLVGMLLVLQLVGIAPRQALVVAQETELEQLARALEEAPRATLPDGNAPEALPPLSTLTNSLAALHKLARAEGVILGQADYQLTQEGELYWRYRITSEGEFAYPAILRMLDKGMKAMPNLSLDSLEIDRSTADIGRPTTKFGVSLYFAKPLQEDGMQ